MPTTLAFVSLGWSQRFGSTALSVVSWAEALIVVGFIAAVLRDQYPAVVVKWMARFGLLLLVAPVLMYLHVPPDSAHRWRSTRAAVTFYHTRAFFASFYWAVE